MYDSGKGVQQNYKEAIKWFTKSAEQGNALAQCNLGEMCEHGEGVEQDLKEAIKWYKKAEEQGIAKAKTALREILESKQILHICVFMSSTLKLKQCKQVRKRFFSTLKFIRRPRHFYAMLSALARRISLKP